MQPVCTTRRRKARIPRTGASRGFTLTELITVVVILGIIAAFTAPRFFDRVVFEERGFYEEVVAALRYGQKIAVGSGCPVRISIDASGYALAQQVELGTDNRCDPDDVSWAVPVLLPDGQAAAGSTPAGVTLGPDETFLFDGLGQTDLGSDLTVNVGAWSLVVQAQSGYVLTP